MRRIGGQGGTVTYWYGAEVEAAVRAEEAKVLTFAAMDMRDYIKDRISTPHPSVSAARNAYLNKGGTRRSPNPSIYGPSRQAMIVKTTQRLAATRQRVRGLAAIDRQVNIGNSKYPYARTKHLHDSIQYEIDTFEHDGTVARIGTNVIYGKYLELGFFNMWAGAIIRRPWLSLGFNERAPHTAKLLGRFAP